MTHDLILVLSSGIVGFILGTAIMLVLRQRPGASRVWEQEPRQVAPKNGDDLSRTDKKQTVSVDTKRDRALINQPAPRSERLQTLSTTTSSRLPVAMLTAKNGERQGKTWVLRQASSTTIGRFDDCDIAIDDHGVSRLHAQITHRTDAATAHEFTIFDYSSTNGTLVNNQPINAVASLQDGDVILIGSTAFTFQRVRHE